MVSGELQHAMDTFARVNSVADCVLITQSGLLNLFKTIIYILYRRYIVISAQRGRQGICESS